MTDVKRIFDRIMAEKELLESDLCYLRHQLNNKPHSERRSTFYTTTGSLTEHAFTLFLLACRLKFSILMAGGGDHRTYRLGEEVGKAIDRNQRLLLRAVCTFKRIFTKIFRPWEA